MVCGQIFCGKHRIAEFSGFREFILNWESACHQGKRQTAKTDRHFANLFVNYIDKETAICYNTFNKYCFTPCFRTAAGTAVKTK